MCACCVFVFLVVFVFLLFLFYNVMMRISSVEPDVCLLDTAGISHSRLQAGVRVYSLVARSDETRNTRDVMYVTRK